MSDLVTVPRARLRALIAAILAFQARTRSADPALIASVVGLLNATSTPREFVSMDEAASILGVSERTIRRRVRDGTLPHRRMGARVLVPLSAINGPARPPAASALDPLEQAG